MREDLAREDPLRSRENSLRALTQWTTARIGMGRAGASTPTRATLDFAMDHARARDAIHAGLGVEKLTETLREAAFSVVRAWSCARDREEYLRRPDLGRMLAPECVGGLEAGLEEGLGEGAGLLTVVVADGLSSLAPTRHAQALLERLRDGLTGWRLDSVVIATQARVGLGDGIGEARGAEATIVLIGERPGLQSADSMGAYLTYRPRVGRTDAERNCVSNIRSGGLSYEQAALKLLKLLDGARLLARSGVDLKDESDVRLRDDGGLSADAGLAARS